MSRHFIAFILSFPVFITSRLLRSTRPQELTESEAEYVVNCVKHVFASHVVFQFNVTNALAGQWIDSVTVDLELGAGWIEEVGLSDIVSCSSSHVSFQTSVTCGPLATDASGTCFVCCSRADDAYSLGLFSIVFQFLCLITFSASCTATLKYKLKDSLADPGFADEYRLENVDVSEADVWVICLCVVLSGGAVSPVCETRAHCECA